MREGFRIKLAKILIEALHALTVGREHPALVAGRLFRMMPAYSSHEHLKDLVLECLYGQEIPGEDADGRYRRAVRHIQEINPNYSHSLIAQMIREVRDEVEGDERVR